MIELLTRLLALQWRRSGAAIHEVDCAGARIWYAEFAPAAARPPRRGAPAPRGRGRRRGPPTLVLLHGLGASGASFFPVIGRLRRGGYRVVVPDLPGYGASRTRRGREAPTFAELVDAVEALVERVAPGGTYLAGNSMGGWIAAKLAARRPDLARGIALLNPGGPALKAEDWSDFTRVIGSDDALASRRFVSRLFHRPPLGVRLLHRSIHRMIRQPAVQRVVSTLRPEDFVSEEDLARVDCPSVLIWGENDRFIPEGCRSFFLEKLPRVRYEPVPDCGHCPQLECPRRTAEILLGLSRMRRGRSRRSAA